MEPELSRRQFLRAAGGITFLALTPVGRGLFAATGSGTKLPVFTALPYIQPGHGSQLVQHREAAVIAWQTENQPAQFKLEYGGNKRYGKVATITSKPRLSGNETRLNYAATLGNLPLGQKIFYRVTGNSKTVVEGFFTTRQPRGARTRFVALGDNACQNIGNRNVAYQAYLKHPDFVMNVGDSVYGQGLDSEYTRYFFTVFNANEATPQTGAPLLRSVPYYSVLGNHDINFRDPERHIAAANFDDDAGALGYYTNMYLPANGLKTPPQVTPVCGDAARIAHFRQAAGGRFPQMANYSFEHGDIHFLCLDSNLYVDPADTELQKWIAADLAATDARWRFVVYHHPAFNVGRTHYAEQHMRVLSPLLESHGVDIVLNGHEHIYQRTRPLRFRPEDSSQASNLHKSDRLIPGQFTVDRQFDGHQHTKPDGILYITTGAGGQVLYDSEQNNNPATWTHRRDNNAAYVARLVSDRHSFTLFDVERDELTMKQIDQYGGEIETIRVTKI